MHSFRLPAAAYGFAAAIILGLTAIVKTNAPAVALFDMGNKQTETPLPELPGDGPWVVRAYYQDRQTLNNLAARFEPWEVHSDEQYAVIEIQIADIPWLYSLGLKLVVEPELTEQITTPAAMLPEQTSGIPGYPCYRTVEETFTSAAGLAAAYPYLAEWIDIGDSWKRVAFGEDSGYDMMVLRLTNEQIIKVKPRLFVISAIHAREYAPAELSMRFAEYLVSQYNKDANITWMLDEHEIHLLLQANPDGRERAEAGLTWRKNTNNNYCSDTTYRGADLNRNFSFYWGCCGGSSTNQCSEIYRGPTPASEPETQAIQYYLSMIFEDKREDSLSSPADAERSGLMLDLHSYGQLVLWPWGFTEDETANSAALVTLGRKLAYFNSYTPYQSISLYPTDGDTNDYAYGELGLPAYTIELGTAFFQDCTTFDNTIYPDNLKSLLFAASTARTPYLTPSGPETRRLSLTPNLLDLGNVITMTATLDDTRFSQLNGTEPSQSIDYGAFSIDTPPWDDAAVVITDTVAAVDGVFDEPIEPVQAIIPTSELFYGRHTIYMWAVDTAGNSGPVSAQFVITTPGLKTYFPIIMK